MDWGVTSKSTASLLPTTVATGSGGGGGGSGTGSPIRGFLAGLSPSGSSCSSNHQYHHSSSSSVSSVSHSCLALLRSRILRAHTLKVVLITSLIWITLGFCVLVYYTECLDGVSCGRGGTTGPDTLRAGARRGTRPYDISSAISSNSNGGNSQQHSSNFSGDLKRSDNSRSSSQDLEDNEIQQSSPYSATSPHLRPYTRHQLHLWEVPVIHSNPSHWPGENGKGVVLPRDLERLKNEKFKLNQFNILASDRMALNRSLPDVRMEACKDKTFPNRLPSTSIVIVFHNEAWSTLLRTVHSIIRMSPRELLKEIILVDDASEREYLGEELEEYVSKLSVPVHVFRTGKRSGLIRARLIGAKHVKGETITFLDAHCECTTGWLEALMARIAEDRTRVVCPIIDVISDENFEYIPASDMTWGGFNWKLNFRWYRVPQRELERRSGDRTQPVRTPTMAGGLFSIDTEFFNILGQYDEGMDIWGGENLELSFRIWMCGGTLEIVTCSHVGHVFRKSTPYTFPGGTSKIVNHNNARLADVWLDEWRDFYFALNPAAKVADRGDTSGRKELRNKLQCHSFRWYLENVYPESQMPLDYYSLGEIRNQDTNVCLDTYGRKSGEPVGVTSCHGQGGNQVFAFTKRRQIMSDDNCLDVGNARDNIKLIRCHGMGGNQAWEYDFETKAITHVNSGLCLDVPDASGDRTLPRLKPCDASRQSQKWILNSNFKWQASDHSRGIQDHDPDHDAAGAGIVAGQNAGLVQDQAGDEAGDQDRAEE